MLDGKRIKGMSVIGIILGIIGMYLLVSQKELVFQENTLLGIIMIFTCVISWSFGSLFVAKAELPSNFFINTGYQMVSGGILLGVTSFIIGEEWLSPFLWTTPVKISTSGICSIKSSLYRSLKHPAITRTESSFLAS